MNKLIYILTLGCLFTACREFEEIAPCSDPSGVNITFDNTPCTIPCSKTFNLSQLENVPGANFTWTLAGPSGPVVLDDAQASSVSVDLTEAGTYTINTQIAFSFEGCDFSRDRIFAIGIDPPRPVINVTPTTCVVGECELTFTQANESTDSWTWSFPEDANTYANQNEVTYHFNEAPGTYEVCLEACNLSGCETVCVDIEVRPKTFMLTTDMGLGLERVLCGREHEDGSFSLIGNNENISFATYSFDLNRAGDTLSTLEEHDDLPNFYSMPIGRSCKQVSDNQIIVGNATYNNADTDFYLATFGSTFLPGTEKGFKSSADGNEQAYSITEGINGGYVVCGNTRHSSGTSTAPEGMAFIELDQSFNPARQTDVFLYTNNPGNTAVDIIALGDEYLVAGLFENKGCYFRLNAELEFIEGSFTDLGLSFKVEFIVKTGDNSFVIVGRTGGSAVLHSVTDGESQTIEPWGLTRIRGGQLINEGQQLALVGSRGTVQSKSPLLLVIDPTNLTATPTIEKTYPIEFETGELLHIHQTSDGGFLLGGSVGLGADRQILLIRTNQLGTL